MNLDLVVLVPANDEREVLRALLEERTRSLGIRQLSYRIVKHHQRDSGCFKEPEGVTEVFRNLASRLLVVFDHDGSGQEARPAAEVAGEVKDRLERHG